MNIYQELALKVNYWIESNPQLDLLEQLLAARQDLMTDGVTTVDSGLERIVLFLVITAFVAVGVMRGPINEKSGVKS